MYSSKATKPTSEDYLHDWRGSQRCARALCKTENNKDQPRLLISTVMFWEKHNLKKKKSTLRTWVTPWWANLNVEDWVAYLGSSNSNIT